MLLKNIILTALNYLNPLEFASLLATECQKIVADTLGLLEKVPFYHQHQSKNINSTLKNFSYIFNEDVQHKKNNNGIFQRCPIYLRSIRQEIETILLLSYDHKDFFSRLINNYNIKKNLAIMIYSDKDIVLTISSIRHLIIEIAVSFFTNPAFKELLPISVRIVVSFCDLLSRFLKLLKERIRIDRDYSNCSAKILGNSMSDLLQNMKSEEFSFFQTTGTCISALLQFTGLELQLEKEREKNTKKFNDYCKYAGREVKKIMDELNIQDDIIEEMGEDFQAIFDFFQSENPFNTKLMTVDNPDKFKKPGLFKEIKNDLISDLQSVNSEQEDSVYVDKDAIKCRVIFDFTATSSSELSVITGDICTLINHQHDRWSLVSKEGKKGLIPTSHLKIISVALI